MKTNVIMTRPMGQFEVLQRTNDSMFSATGLLHQWNKVKGNAEKKMSRFLEAENTKEFITALKTELSHGAEMHCGDIQIIKTTKGRGTKRGNTKDEHWFHPYLFLKFAMWLNPAFEVKVIKFVYDELIKNRHLAGDSYRSLSASASIFPNVNYVQIAKGLNWITFNKHYKDIRNDATNEQLEQLHKVEEQLCFAIDMRLIRNYSSFIETMRKMYNDKYQKF